MELKKSKIKRRKYVKIAWIYFILFVFVLPVMSYLSSYILPPELNSGGLLSILLGSICISFIPSLCIFGGFLIHCYSLSGTQTMHLFENEAVYSLYNGSLDNREVYTFYIDKLKGYKKSSRNIKIYGEFKKKTVDRFGVHNSVAKRLTIARTFEQEEELLTFFDKIII